MSEISPRGVIAAAIAAALLANAAAASESCTLELKRLDPPKAGQGYTPAMLLFRSGSPQHFFMQTGPEGGGVATSQSAAEFAKIVKKEAKYVSKHPFRGVAKLGDDQYAFALDALPPAEKDAAESKTDKPAAKPEKQAKGPGSAPAKPAAKASQPERYARLFFDLNRNGDLTDDKVIEAQDRPERGLRGYPAGYWQAQFPRVDLAIRAGDAKVDWSFFFSVYSHSSPGFSYVSASLNAAAYREGQITLEGKSRRVVLLDYNSNGRFDDQTQIRGAMRGPGERLYPAPGDVLMLDPDAQQGFVSPFGMAAEGGRHQVSKMVNIDGRFYDLAITPSGDKLTLTPSAVALGKITNPAKRFQATVYGDQGFLQIRGGKSQPVELPEGEWKLLSYTIEHTGAEEPEPPPPEKNEPAAKDSSLLRALAKALVGGPQSAVPGALRQRNSMVSAQGTEACKAVRVRKGETVAFPFGPPYKPLVKVEYASGAEARLELLLVGAAGEICSNLMVRGDRPDAPEFTITDPNGKVVEQGRFKYG